MNKLKYAIYHGKIVILLLIILLYFITSFIFDTISQFKSADDGIEMLFVDVWVSSDGNGGLVDSVKEKTNTEYVGYATISEKEITDYVKTISNYTVSDHLNITAESKDVEIIFVPERLLDDVYKMQCIVPLEITGDFDENCYYDGVLYAFPLKDALVTDNNAKILALENTYAVLLDGDHVDDMRSFLINLPMEEK